MTARVLTRLIETAPGRVLYRVARLPVMRPLATGLLRIAAWLRETGIRHQTAHRHHDAQQRAILNAFEADTARLAAQRAQR